MRISDWSSDGCSSDLFSGSACWSDDDAIGLLHAAPGSDPLDAAAWRQIDGPVLAKSVANSVYAPGHNGFFTSPDGRETWIVYHANPAAGMKCTGKRSPRIQRIDWSAKGWAIFPAPAAAGAPLAALSAARRVGCKCERTSR